MAVKVVHCTASPPQSASCNYWELASCRMMLNRHGLTLLGWVQTTICLRLSMYASKLTLNVTSRTSTALQQADGPSDHVPTSNTKVTISTKVNVTLCISRAHSLPPPIYFTYLLWTQRHPGLICFSLGLPLRYDKLPATTGG
jgi:hypothetical protein